MPPEKKSPEPQLVANVALSKMQGELPAVLSDGSNSRWETKYTKIGPMLEHLLPRLAANDFCVTQIGIKVEGEWLLRTTLHHICGGSFTSDLPILCKDPDDPQKLSGAITYMRKAGLKAICGLPETEYDDDANRASTPPPAPPAPKRAPTPPPPKPAEQPSGTRWEQSRQGKGPTASTPEQPAVALDALLDRIETIQDAATLEQASTWYQTIKDSFDDEERRTITSAFGYASQRAMTTEIPGHVNADAKAVPEGQ